MAGKRKEPAWRARFLRGLARYANVRLAAQAAGVDAGTAYNHRKKDAGFAARWDAAKARGPEDCWTPGMRRRRRPREPDLTLRRTASGEQMIRASDERWNPDADAAFFATLKATACIARAAEACGFSRAAIDRRRKAYPEFDAELRAAEAAAKEELHRLVVRAGIAAFDPDSEVEAPPVSVGDAIAILRLKGTGGPAAAAPPLPPAEEVREEVMRRIRAIRRHRELEEGGDEGDDDGRC